MKVLAALGVVQIVLILFLLVKLAGGGGMIAEGTDKHVTGPAIETSMPAGESQATTVHRDPDEDRLRQIVREELAAYFNESSTADEPPTGAGDRTQDTYQRQYVEQQIDYYRNIGAISDRQMEELQAEIAKLRGSDQKQMLSELVRAMNAGEIAGKML